MSRLMTVAAFALTCVLLVRASDEKGEDADPQAISRISFPIPFLFFSECGTDSILIPIPTPPPFQMGIRLDRS